MSTGFCSGCAENFKARVNGISNSEDFAKLPNAFAASRIACPANQILEI